MRRSVFIFAALVIGQSSEAAWPGDGVSFSQDRTNCSWPPAAITSDVQNEWQAEALPAPRVLEIYADQKGGSHFRCVAFEMTKFIGGGTISKAIPAGDFWLRIAPKDQDAGFHVAPRRQVVITLNGGTAEFETSDGERRRVAPGEILLVEDTFGKGHKTRTVNNMNRYGITLSVL